MAKIVIADIDEIRSVIREELSRSLPTQHLTLKGYKEIADYFKVSYATIARWFYGKKFDGCYTKVGRTVFLDVAKYETKLKEEQWQKQ